MNSNVRDFPLDIWTTPARIVNPLGNGGDMLDDILFSESTDMAVCETYFPICAAAHTNIIRKKKLPQSTSQGQTTIQNIRKVHMLSAVSAKPYQ